MSLGIPKWCIMGFSLMLSILFTYLSTSVLSGQQALLCVVPPLLILTQKAVISFLLMLCNKPTILYIWYGKIWKCNKNEYQTSGIAVWIFWYSVSGICSKWYNVVWKFSHFLSFYWHQINTKLSHLTAQNSARSIYRPY